MCLARGHRRQQIEPSGLSRADRGGAGQICVCRVWRAPVWIGGTCTQGQCEDRTRQLTPTQEEEGWHVREPAWGKLLQVKRHSACVCTWMVEAPSSRVQQAPAPFRLQVHVPDEAPQHQITEGQPLARLSTSVFNKHRHCTNPRRCGLILRSLL